MFELYRILFMGVFVLIALMSYSKGRISEALFYMLLALLLK